MLIINHFRKYGVEDELDSPGVPLFQEFKRAVDRAYPLKPAGKSKKP